MKILVTGASGFLGQAVLRRLAKEHRVVGQCHRHGAPGLTACDLREEGALRRLLREAGPDVVVHTAAYREPDYCEEHPAEAERLNVAPARIMAEALPAKARLIFISSDYVFNGLQPPYREDARRVPVNTYGCMKVEAEDLVLAHGGGLVVRVPVLVGAGPTLAQSGYIGQLVATVRDKTPLVQDHVQVRVPTWIEDVAEALAFLITRGARGTMHVAGPRAATRYESMCDVARLLGESHAHLTPSMTVVPRRAARPPNPRLAVDRLRAMGHVCSTDLMEVVRKVVGELPIAD